MNHKANVNKKGFTLIELMLAMTFISMLLLTIALTIMQIATIYNKGMITKEVNQSSRTISDELSLAMRSSGTFSLSTKYIQNTWGGRLCMGQYSYIWNYGKALAAPDPSRNQYSAAAPSGNTVISGGVTRYEISLVKVPDAGGSYCVANGSGVYPKIDPTNAVELLRTGDHGLVLHNLTVTSVPSASDALSSQQLYTVSYTIGTNDLNALNSDQTLCKGPGVPGSDLNYCVVNQFTIVLRVVNGVN
ncbi:MAG: type II secretion system protein [Candidatus Microsaccharimonas sossegonensis]|uniref:Type II secretion system protein n=1 Tax=Candidatus Microsaccharimonas sossegonensis TaxID=2506948 RepID=A0A4Q0AH23_9BACT|nr:MAG: type II secretion system protein [Candidatus Microsaccharimonas sossegonensis]